MTSLGIIVQLQLKVDEDIKQEEKPKDDISNNDVKI